MLVHQQCLRTFADMGQLFFVRRRDTMNEAKIAAPLLAILASGETIERVWTGLPMFKPQIELAFDWMQSKAKCTAAEIGNRAIRLREVVLKKDEAIRNRDWDLAADMRAKECAIYEFFGLDCPKGVSSAIQYGRIEEQIHNLSKLLNETMNQPTDNSQEPN